MGPQVAIGDEKEADMGPTSLQKGVRKGSKSETLEKLKIELSPARELRSAPERAPQMEPENWVADGKHKNEARGARRSPTWAPDGALRGQKGDYTDMGEPEARTPRRLANPVI